MSIPTPEHPQWCSPVPIWCTAGQEGGAHRSAPVLFTAPAVEMALSLHRGDASPDTFVAMSVYSPGDIDGLHFTLALDDAQRLADTLAGLLERAR